MLDMEFKLQSTICERIQFFLVYISIKENKTQNPRDYNKTLKVWVSRVWKSVLQLISTKNNFKRLKTLRDRSSSHHKSLILMGKKTDLRPKKLIACFLFHAIKNR